MLADAGADNSDLSYEGAPSSFSLDYARQKAREFQETLNQVDAVANAARDAIAADISPELSSDLGALLSDFDAKKTAFRFCAEGINAGARSYVTKPFKSEELLGKVLHHRQELGHDRDP